ncbi:hypothetical protein BDV38DRAFT_150550 [Aspergillus pseudotamarii]|uniref:Uncharacterized protein n=1 Tax=Aspergillus pseudotamarii TaxID=132259 RepID=A0A5N6T7E2_ASPPS|nr:uncharacterized protein BDV38DRAFT_150550 [Aspergillus pseudotamarii]KAE8142129.1 hypothetical protein BDV38DRAFT_150550 [Aspergillus pseudotamarii]
MSWISAITTVSQWILLYPVTFLIYYGYGILQLLVTPLVKLGQFALHCTLWPFNIILKFEVRKYLNCISHQRTTCLSPIPQMGMVVDILTGFFDLCFGSHTHWGITGAAIVLYEFLYCGNFEPVPGANLPFTSSTPSLSGRRHQETEEKRSGKKI